MAVRGHEIYQAEVLNVHAHIDKLWFRTWQLYTSDGTATKDWWVIVCDLGPAHCDAIVFQGVCLGLQRAAQRLDCVGS